MKLNHFLFCTCFFILSTKAQFGPPQLISSQQVDEIRNTIPIDLDGDNDIDIITHTITGYLEWYENLDGQGTFSPKKSINNTPISYNQIEALDYDADGDNDIVFIGNNPSTLKWIENLDGKGNFGEENLILQEDSIFSFHFLDFDNDGDLDLFTSIFDFFDARLSWFPNIDGQGTVGDEINLLEDITLLEHLNVTDIDGDGLLDFIGSHENSGIGAIIWYKNLGNQTLSEENIILEFAFRSAFSDFTSVTFITIVDLDGDQLEDILFGTANDNTGKFTGWIKRIDQEANFGEALIRDDIKGGLFFDFDNDGDNDILYKERLKDNIGWLEFTTPTNGYENEYKIETNAIEITNINGADIDGDGLIDAISSSVGDGKIVWYKNSGILSIPNFESEINTLVPNPVDNKGFSAINPTNTYKSLTVYSLSGNSLTRATSLESLNDFISILSTGAYLLEVTDIQDTKTIYKFLKK